MNKALNVLLGLLIYMIPVVFFGTLAAMFAYMYTHRAEGPINPVFEPKRNTIKCSAGVFVTDAGEYRACTNEEGGKWKQQVKWY